MNHLLSTTTEGLKLNLFQSVLGCTKEKIKNKSYVITNQCRDLQITSDESSGKIVEIQMDNSTLSCYFTSNGQECNVSYLFPDNESEMRKFIDLCNEHYVPFPQNLWVNQQENTCIRLSKDSDVGYMFTCTRIGNN